MKKNISINISGIIFHVEEDGYERLKSYLESINQYFSTFEDSKEIIADIENRIAEIFLTKLKDGNQVVYAEDIDSLIATMGTISDFEAMEEESTFSEEAQAPPPPSIEEPTEQMEEENKPRRLYRDTKRRVLGGVASGIAHYFKIDPLWIRLLFVLFFVNILLGGLSGIIFITYIVLWIVVPGNAHLEEDEKIKKMFRNPDSRVLGGVASGIASYFGADPTVVRLLFVLSIFLGGTGIILYIILWLITPEAKSITDKMQMQGEPVTLSNIEQNVKKSLNVKEGEETTFVKILLFPFRIISTVIMALGKLLGPLLKFILEAARILAGVVLLAIGASFIISLTIFLGVALGLYSGWTDFITMDPIPIELIQNTVPAYLAVFCFLAALIPSIALVLGGLAVIAKRSVANAYVGWGMFGLWVISLLGISFTAPAIAKEWTRDGEFFEQRTFDMGSKTTILKLRDISSTYNEMASLKIRGHEESTYLLEMRYEARGSDRDNAIQNAQMIGYAVEQKDSLLYFDSNVSFKEGAVFRAQDLEMTLYVPYGAVFMMDSELRRILENTLYRNGYRVAQLGENKWTFNEGRLECITCTTSYSGSRRDDAPRSGSNQDYNETITFDFDDFTAIEAYHRYDIEITQSNKYTVVVKAVDDDIRKVEATKQGDRLVFEYDDGRMDWHDYVDEPMVKIYITMPVLEDITLYGGSSATISGFDQDNFALLLKGSSQIDVSGDYENVRVDLENASKATFRGDGVELNAGLTGASSLEAFDFHVDYAEVNSSGASKAKVYIKKNLTGNASGVSTVRYRGPGSFSGEQNRNFRRE